MPINVKIKLTNLKTFLPSVQRHYARTAPVPIRKRILEDLNAGVSPVKGKGKFPKYSEFYLDAIRGQPHIDDSGQPFIWRATKGGKAFKVYVSDDFVNTDVTGQASGKSVSPVNLKLTGKLHKSLSVAIFAFQSRVAMRIQFDHFLADIHNRLGAGRKGVLRRLLPTGTGERFNARTHILMKSLLQNSVNFVVKKFK